ncbi:LysR family transcriptional regulator [Bailinhaonella thermotolerans]|uniref:LysR family transcriptional regulator n=1 Tax=Bailinhaonella thermotolerans TaxID=1070861 RepID=A0A3A4AT63_9ACTN|nr:LysR family transcriptional regulator [Bailinhaonella thermotolerans]RJL24568.1 LysR family transcriptional regulator [Bailinhaonella thermotolerans]
MELRQLAYFVAVADHGGFARAAESLHIVQPAVSQQVQRLERELGVRLFDRSTRHVRLTDEGARLLPEARAALAAADRVRQVAADLVTGASVTLRLGTSPGPGPQVYRVLEELAGVRARLVKVPLAERLAGVRSGELDAALVRSLPAVPGLELIPVWSDPLIVALPADHPLAAEPVLRLEQLGDLPLRLAPRENNPPFHDLITAACRTAGVDPPAGPPFTTLQDTLADLASGFPSWTVFYPVQSELPRVRSVAFRPLAEPVAVTYLAVPPGPPAVPLRHLLAACAKVFPEV